MVWLMVGIGGALGAPMRFLTDRWMQWWAFGDHESHAWPLGTLVVNLAGGFILGLIVGATRDGSLGPLPAAALGTRLCGAHHLFDRLGRGGAPGRGRSLGRRRNGGPHQPDPQRRAGRRRAAAGHRAVLNGTPCDERLGITDLVSPPFQLATVALGWSARATIALSPGRHRTRPLGSVLGQHPVAGLGQRRADPFGAQLKDLHLETPGAAPHLHPVANHHPGRRFGGITVETDPARLHRLVGSAASFCHAYRPHPGVQPGGAVTHPSPASITTVVSAPPTHSAGTERSPASRADAACALACPGAADSTHHTLAPAASSTG